MQRKFMDVLNNREIAVAVWLLVIFVYIILSPQMAESKKTFKNVLSSFFVTKIMLVICLICFYMIFVIYWLSRFGLWNYEQLKNTIFWCVSVAFMSLFKISQIKKDRNFIKNEIFAQLKILAIIQFIISVYSFSLWFEIILVPILTIIGLIFNISKKDEKYIQAKKPWNVA